MVYLLLLVLLFLIDPLWLYLVCLLLCWYLLWWYDTVVLSSRFRVERSDDPFIGVLEKDSVLCVEEVAVSEYRRHGPSFGVNQEVNLRWIPRHGCCARYSEVRVLCVFAKRFVRYGWCYRKSPAEGNTIPGFCVSDRFQCTGFYFEYG